MRRPSQSARLYESVVQNPCMHLSFHQFSFSIRSSLKKTPHAAVLSLSSPAHHTIDSVDPTRPRRRPQHWLLEIR